MLISLAEIIGVSHPAKVLGIPWADGWKKHRQPWPAPLLWALAGHSFAWLAKELAVPPSTAYSWASGTLPPLLRVFEVADICKVEPAELVPTVRMVKDSYTR